MLATIARIGHNVLLAGLAIVGVAVLLQVA